MDKTENNGISESTAALCDISSADMLDHILDRFERFGEYSSEVAPEDREQFYNALDALKAVCSKYNDLFTSDDEGGESAEEEAEPNVTDVFDEDDIKYLKDTYGDKWEEAAKIIMKEGKLDEETILNNIFSGTKPKASDYKLPETSEFIEKHKDDEVMPNEEFQSLIGIIPRS